MKFNEEKLQQLKKLITSLCQNQKQAIKNSEKLRDMDMCNTTQKQREKTRLNADYAFQYSEKLAKAIYSLIIDLGFQDFEGDYMHDGWAERKK